LSTIRPYSSVLKEPYADAGPGTAGIAAPWTGEGKAASGIAPADIGLVGTCVLAVPATGGGPPAQATSAAAKTKNGMAIAARRKGFRRADPLPDADFCLSNILEFILASMHQPEYTE
jgi:hypothetical protein